MVNTILSIRFVTILAVLAALFAAILMFVIGAVETFEAYRVFLRIEQPRLAGDPNLDATVKVLTSLDSFMFGLVLLYFAYSVFFLFIRENTSGARVNVPEWLQVQDLEQMKKTMLEVIIVLLAVLFLIVSLENQLSPELNWNLVLIPAGILAIAGAVKLMHIVRKKPESRETRERKLHG